MITLVAHGRELTMQEAADLLQSRGRTWSSCSTMESIRTTWSARTGA
jgi:hypothetical protein